MYEANRQTSPRSTLLYRTSLRSAAILPVQRHRRFSERISQGTQLRLLASGWRSQEAAQFRNRLDCHMLNPRNLRQTEDCDSTQCARTLTQRTEITAHVVEMHMRHATHRCCLPPALHHNSRGLIGSKRLRSRAVLLMSSCPPRWTRRRKERSSRSRSSEPACCTQVGRASLFH